MRARAEIVVAHGPGAERTWRRVRHGMYVPPGEKVTAEVRALAELRARPTAVLSGPAAARAWGHPWVADFVEDVIVITPGEHPGSTIPAGISIRRGALDDDIVHADIGGTPLRLAGPLDVTIDCVEKLSDPEAIAFLDGAIRAWDIESRLKEWAATNRGRGAKRMRELLQWVDWRAESRPREPATDIAAALRLHRLGAAVSRARARGIEKYRRAVDAERDAELAWRRRRAIDGAKAPTRRWLDR